jgi:HD-GYP domain-containing protein (c-di-GMP phosphodiesterase class II)
VANFDASLIELDAQDARSGLFVAALDRPWQDTPFLLQGLLLQEDDVEQLKRLCKKIYVDPRRSDAQAVQWMGQQRAARAEARDKAGGMRAPQPNPGFVIYGQEQKQASLIQGLKEDLQLPGRQAHQALMREPGARLPTLTPRDLAEVTAKASLLWIKLRKGWHDLLNPEDGAPKPLSKFKRPKFVDKDEALLRYPPAPPIDKAALDEANRNISNVQAAINRMYADVDLKIGLHLEDLEDSMVELVNTVLSDPNAAMWMARMRDHDSSALSRAIKTAVFMMTFGRHIGYSREGLLKLGMIGMLLDIGKIKVEKTVLAHKGALSPSQWDELRAHVQRGVDLLENERRLDPDVRLAILHHHERADGSGYPLGLHDEKISTFGRMAGIVDAVAAMTSDRVYAGAVSTYDALRELMTTCSKLFNRALLEQFVQAIGVFPVGSLVELSTGEVAAVTGHNPIRRLEPRVLVLTQPDKQPLRAPFERDLLYRPTDAAGKPIYIVRGLPVGAYGVDPRKYYLD